MNKALVVEGANLKAASAVATSGGILILRRQFHGRS